MEPVASQALIRVRGLKQYFAIKRGYFGARQYVKAIDDVSFDVGRNTTLGVVGESGSGKTTLGRALLRLIEPTAGTIAYGDTDITTAGRRTMLMMRRKMQMVAQDPYNALHPRKLVKNIIGEGLKIHFRLSSPAIYARVKEILEQVGLKEEHMFRYPHEFSGGQRQRISVARALVLRPEFLVLDEPTSALDVSVQAVILKMIKDLKRDFALTYLFITHDLAVVDYLADDVAVMYLGQLAEIGPKALVFTKPAHPYTELLLNAILHPNPKRRQVRDLPKGEIPSPLNPPTGCRFHTRCPFVRDYCRKLEPAMTEVRKGHRVRCHFPLSVSST